jgi:transposase
MIWWNIVSRRWIMLDKRTIFEIHRLDHQGWSHRKIARHLCVARTSVKRYLENPERTFPKRPARPSKLDPYRDLIEQLLEQDPHVHATVILQRLQKEGFDGKITILRRLSENATKKNPESLYTV